VAKDKLVTVTASELDRDEFAPADVPFVRMLNEKARVIQ
jgi:hypothetical protein